MGDFEDKVEAYRRGMEQGDMEAALQLGLLLAGDSEVRDLQGAIGAYERGIELGDCAAALNLGNLLIREPEVHDRRGAIEAYLAGIALGDADAALNLGNFLRDDAEAPDPQGAALAFEEGVKLGDRRAAVNLGNLLAGDPHVRNLAGAVDAYRKAAEWGEAKAAFNLGILLSEESPEQDLKQAVEAYREAIKMGEAAAAWNLGHLLLTESEVRDPEAAIAVYVEGAEMGEPHCVLGLGLLYANEKRSDGDRQRPFLSEAERMFLARGRDHESEGRIVEALADYGQAVRLGSADAAFLAAKLMSREVESPVGPPEREAISERDKRVFTTLESLKDHLESLPPPAPGHVRVFRGQRRDHGSLIPASLRPGARSSHNLAVLTVAVTRYLLDVVRIDHPEIDTTPLVSIWIWAIAQHYGPGSPYLDVTTSLDVALWFALHEAERVEVGAEVEALASEKPNPELPLELDAYSFAPAAGPGFLYVLDVPVPAEYDGPLRGQLIDLSAGPKLFAESARVRAQEACLVLGSGDEPEDLSSLLVSEPIEVTWPMSGSVCGSMSTRELFPPPGVDQWYAHLLEVPLIAVPDRSSGRPALRQAVPVTLYGSDDLAVRSIARRIWRPLSLFDHLSEEQKRRSPDERSISEPDDVTAISLHFPIRMELPDASGESWNHGLAGHEVPTAAPLLDLSTGKRTEVPLEKVFVEFSPLEHPNWVGKGSSDFCRGTYLERSDLGYRMWLFQESFPDQELIAVGPLRIEFDQPNSCFRVGSEKGWEDLKDAPVVNLAFLSVVFLLRMLAAKPLLFPFPWLYAPGKGALIGFSKTTNVLVEANGSHLIYDGQTREPMGAQWMDGTVLLSCPDGWPAVDPVEAQRYADSYGSKFPPSSSTGHGEQ